MKFINLSEPEMGYDYEIVLDETGVYSWNKFRKGTYELTIYKSAYTSCADGEIIEVWDDSTIECQLEEIISSVGDLYVSPTAWAMWSVNEDDAATSYDVYLDGDLEDNVTTTYYQHSDLVVGQSYTTSVVISLFLFGNSFKIEISISPYKVIARVLGIGVAVIINVSTCSPFSLSDFL